MSTIMNAVAWIHNNFHSMSPKTYLLYTLVFNKLNIKLKFYFCNKYSKWLHLKPVCVTTTVRKHENIATNVFSVKNVLEHLDIWSKDDNNDNSDTKLEKKQLLKMLAAYKKTFYFIRYFLS